MEKKRRESSKYSIQAKWTHHIIPEVHKEENHNKEQASSKNCNSLAHGLKKDKIRFSSEFLTEMFYDKTDE